MSDRTTARWLARLLPRELRDEYGSEFVALVEQRLGEEARTGGRGAAWRYKLRGLADVLGTTFRRSIRKFSPARWSTMQGVKPGTADSGPAGAGLPGSGTPNSGRWRLSSSLDTLGQDLKYGCRQLWRNPGFTVVAVLTLTLGIGINAAIFNVVNARLFRLPPVHDPDTLVSLRQSNAALPGRANVLFSYPDYLDYRDRSSVFSGLAAMRLTNSYISGGSYPEQISAEQVSGSYFDVLGVTLSLGRALRPADDDPAAEPVAVISHELWQRQFDGDPAAIGADLVLNGSDPFTIVGGSRRWSAAPSPGQASTCSARNRWRAPATR